MEAKKQERVIDSWFTDEFRRCGSRVFVVYDRLASLVAVFMQPPDTQEATQ